jgi:hypothetical protein
MQGNVGVSFVNAAKHAQLTVVLLLIMHERVSIIYKKDIILLKQLHTTKPILCTTRQQTNLNGRQQV